MALTNYYCDPAINANSGTGTIGDPFGDLQYALNTIVRDAVNGDQINVKAGTAEVLAAALDRTAYGAHTDAAPLVIRGYTAAANDGGEGAINLQGFSLFATAPAAVAIIDMYCYGTHIAGTLVNVGNHSLVYRCRVIRTHVGGWGTCINSSWTGGIVAQCYAENGMNTGGSCIATASKVIGCYVKKTGTSRGIFNVPIVIGNVVHITYASGYNGIECSGNAALAINNVVFSSAAFTGYGISATAYAGDQAVFIANNIVYGMSGAGGVGIYMGQGDPLNVSLNNAIGNCTTPSNYTNVLLQAGDVTLVADPFTNAAAGDFSLTAAAKTALRGVGWPAAYLGAHANTDGHITIGAIQYGEAEVGGGIIKRAMRMIGG